MATIPTRDTAVDCEDARIFRLIAAIVLPGTLAMLALAIWMMATGYNRVH